MNTFLNTRNGLLCIAAMTLSGCSTYGFKYPPVQLEPAKPMLIVILDTSGSMSEIDTHGEVKLAAAKNTIYDVINKVPIDSTRMSLMTFNGCQTQMNVPLYNTNTSVIKQNVYQLRAGGGTPLAASIAQARYMLRGQRGKATVLLVSDGQESCGGNPCYEAMLLQRERNIDLKVFTFGYGVNAATQDQLRCVADKTGGAYADAGDAISLQHAIRNIVTQEVTLAIDSDGDGILNKDDKCPATPGDFKVDANGCGTVYAFQIAFPTGSYKIGTKFQANIKKLAVYLLTNNVKIELGGHTDSSGSEEVNQKLSLKRAEAVLKKLIEFGVPASRISVKGYGESKPLNPNDTLAGRYKNRRVEAMILEEKKAPRITI